MLFNAIRTAIRTVVVRTFGYGKKRSQRQFKRLYYHAIHGMNYSSPHFQDNGELVVARKVARELVQTGSEPLTLFDVGANIGDYALDLRSIFGEKAHIYCFEPSPGCQEVLTKKFSGDPGTHILPVGLGDSEGKLPLHLMDPTSTTASLYELPPNHPWKAVDTRLVDITTADRVCKDLGIAAIHFLKIDVEGHELQVLKGARELLDRRAIWYIQFEFGFRQIDSRCFFRDFYELLSPRYRISRILQDGLEPLDAYDESLEVFVGVSNYLAELRPAAVQEAALAE